MSINDRIVLGRDVTKNECPWLGRDLKKGEVLYRYRGETYGCILPGSMVCTHEFDELPFFEIPLDAVDHIGPDA